MPRVFWTLTKQNIELSNARLHLVLITIRLRANEWASCRSDVVGLNGLIILEPLTTTRVSYDRKVFPLILTEQ